MEISQLVEDDLADLAELLKQFWNEESSLEKMKATFQKVSQNPDYIFLTAKGDGILAGFIMGIICEELYGECNPFMVIEDVIVHNAFHRRGIGTKLMHKLEEIATERNCCQTVFVTETERSDAVNFYKSLGYDADKYKGFKKKLGDS